MGLCLYNLPSSEENTYKLTFIPNFNSHFILEVGNLVISLNIVTEINIKK